MSTSPSRPSLLQVPASHPHPHVTITSPTTSPTHRTHLSPSSRTSPTSSSNQTFTSMNALPSTHVQQPRHQQQQQSQQQSQSQSQSQSQQPLQQQAQSQSSQAPIHPLLQPLQQPKPIKSLSLQRTSSPLPLPLPLPPKPSRVDPLTALLAPIKTKRAFEKAMIQEGILLTDPRLAHTLSELNRIDSEHETITVQQLRRVVTSSASLVEKALGKHLVISDFPRFIESTRELFESCRSITTGTIPRYIPDLSHTDPSTWTISFCSIDGQQASLGDHTTLFSVQATAKVVAYLLALEEIGETTVHQYVGREPSGRQQNELVLDHNGLPHNPLINSGAIVCASLLYPDQLDAERFRRIQHCWKRLSGYHPSIGFNNATYLSERETANRNYCLGYMLQEKKVFQTGAGRVSARPWTADSLQKSLDLYFQMCSIECNADAMSIVAASLANGGINPLTGERIFAPENVRNALSLMDSCGMYGASGEWAYVVGLPAKSGVSGVIMVVIPNVGGFGLFSPLVDHHYNSVRGVEFCKMLVQRFHLHVQDHFTQSTWIRPKTINAPVDDINQHAQLCFSCADGDMAAIRALVASGVDLCATNLEGRTALHVAAASGHAHVVKYLVAKKVKIDAKDKFGGTPMIDALKAGHTHIFAYLQHVLEQRKDPSDTTPITTTIGTHSATTSPIYGSISTSTSDSILRRASVDAGILHMHSRTPDVSHVSRRHPTTTIPVSVSLDEIDAHHHHKSHESHPQHSIHTHTSTTSHSIDPFRTPPSTLDPLTSPPLDGYESASEGSDEDDLESISDFSDDDDDQHEAEMRERRRIKKEHQQQVRRLEAMAAEMDRSMRIAFHPDG